MDRVRFFSFWWTAAEEHSRHRVTLPEIQQQNHNDRIEPLSLVTRVVIDDDSSNGGTTEWRKLRHERHRDAVTLPSSRRPCRTECLFSRIRPDPQYTHPIRNALTSPDSSLLVGASKEPTHIDRLELGRRRRNRRGGMSWRWNLNSRPELHYSVFTYPHPPGSSLATLLPASQRVIRELQRVLSYVFQVRTQKRVQRRVPCDVAPLIQQRIWKGLDHGYVSLATPSGNVHISFEPSAPRFYVFTRGYRRRQTHCFLWRLQRQKRPPPFFCGLPFTHTLPRSHLYSPTRTMSTHAIQILLQLQSRHVALAALYFFFAFTIGYASPAQAFQLLIHVSRDSTSGSSCPMIAESIVDFFSRRL
ncbi:hypothetical protein MIND_01288500 [Mycena indigotica]|uniref:Uncharacterized protein n=1 Tax=Mycena indigotica TaxID=2126181 RepID=A0A8H6VRS6_9AGAR|nr:uncharacterized protein MIND_01288500 [Mycena indigotica]KAF7291434.1 hypothetical protein MIND_01288500 [Mycena indigotica]